MTLKYSNLKPISGDASYRVFFRKFDKEKKRIKYCNIFKKGKEKKFTYLFCN